MALRQFNGQKVVGMALVAVVALLVTACGAIGSGDIITEQREVDPFDRVEVSGGMAVDLLVDPAATPEVTVTYDDNLIDRVATRVRGSTLFVEFEDSVQLTGAGRFVAVIVPSLQSVKASGGSDVVGSGVNDELRVEASEGSNVDLTDLTTRAVSLDASGGSDMAINASETVTGGASGGSDVTVVGGPSEVSVDSSDGSDVSVED